MKGLNDYPTNWPEISSALRAKHMNQCERCLHYHDPQHGYTLTVHHLDGNKANCAEWNLAVLCQRCHLHIQGKVNLRQFYMFEHTDWFQPHVEGFYQSIKEIK